LGIRVPQVSLRFTWGYKYAAPTELWDRLLTTIANTSVKISRSMICLGPIHLSPSATGS